MLQQQQARTEAASLLEQRLLPLLSGIQRQLVPAGDQGSQLQHLVSSLNQLSGMLQSAPQGADTQALQLLQWLQQSGALGPGGAAGGLAATPAAPSPSPTPPAAADGSEQLQDALRRVAGLLKRQEELAV